MKITLILPCSGIDAYIGQVENGAAPETAWEECVLAPYWQTLCCYAPMDLSERKPAPLTDIKTLREQNRLLKQLDKNMLEKEFARAAEILPNFDDDPLTAAIFPLDPMNKTVNERQGGVVGTSLFGNLIIRANPLVPGFARWIPYVFAHEYHHTVWGNYWFNLHGGELENKLIDALVIDGEADSFACMLYPDCRPEWLFGLPETEAARLYEDVYRPILFSKEFDYVKYMFGSEPDGIPWCAGYAVGYRLVQNYLRQTGRNVTEILRTKPENLLINE